MRKLTIEYVRERIAEIGYELLSEEYINCSTKLEILCDEGHTYKTSWDNFNDGCICPECQGNKKKTIEEVAEYAAKLGYKLLSTKYINCMTKLDFKCEKGHTFPMSFNDLSQGHDCAECVGKKKKTIEEIRKFAEDIGYELLSDEYINSKTKLIFKCPEGHEFPMIWNSFQQGQRCPHKRYVGMEKEGNPNYRGGVTKLGIPLYDTYAHQIDWIEEVRRSPNNENWLQVRCTNCNEWFIPKTSEVTCRLSAINDKSAGECRFYCSEECKHSCPIFGQHEWPKGFKKDYHRPHDYAVWADLIKKRDGHICQICGETEGINAHHYEGLHVNDMQSLDLDMGVTLCAECHHRSHTGSGCTYYDLQKRNVCGN